MPEKEYLVPGSTPVRATRAVWNSERPNSQIRLETATRIDMNDIDRRSIILLPRELKWLYENTILRAEREAAKLVAPQGAAAGHQTEAAKTDLQHEVGKLETVLDKNGKEVKPPFTKDKKVTAPAA